jgi:lipocalin
MMARPNYHIIDTDYDNYSIVYDCQRSLYYGKNEYLYILSRNQEIDEGLKDELITKIRDAVPTYNFDYNFVYTTQGKMCRYEHLRVLEEKEAADKESKEDEDDK